MKYITSYIILFLLLATSSCNKHENIKNYGDNKTNANLNIIGVWAGDYGGYREVVFDSLGVIEFTNTRGMEDFYMHLYGYPTINYYDDKQFKNRNITLLRSSYKYEIVGESIKFDNGRSAKIYQIDSTILDFSNSILYKLPDTVLTYDDFRKSNTEDAFQDFYKEFINRALEFEKKHKIVYR